MLAAIKLGMRKTMLAGGSDRASRGKKNWKHYQMAEEWICTKFFEWTRARKILEF